MFLMEHFILFFIDIYIVLRYNTDSDISHCDIISGGNMDFHIKKVYVPMTETAFYILLCLQNENHGYGIVQNVKEMTRGQVNLSPGTMYGSLSKMEKDGLIEFVREEDKRKMYKITPLGREVLKLETARIERLYKNATEAKI